MIKELAHTESLAAVSVPASTMIGNPSRFKNIFERFHTAAQVRPEFVNVCCPGKTCGQTYNRNSIFEQRRIDDSRSHVLGSGGYSNLAISPLC